MGEATPLSRAALRSLPTTIRRPAYDPARLQVGIVHLGLGGFHRAHMARYTHAVMETDPSALSWGILGAGLLPPDRRMTESLAPQDYLYTLLERQGDEETVSVIGALAGAIFAAEDSESLLAAIADPAVRIVSLTVTEHGYGLDPATRTLDPAHRAIAADLATPERPRSPVGVIVEAYRRRREEGARPFTALTCDNIQHNGGVLRSAVLAFATLRDPSLADWIEAHGAFPSTMVDRITPLTTEADIADLASRHGVADRWPVVCEVFSQWVIEDDFADGRPAWETAGAQFVRDVAPYESMKLRLLNGSHLAIAALGQLAGLNHVDETLRTAPFERYMRALMDRETGPTLPPLPGVDLAAYKETLVSRFANPRIKDTLRRITTDAPINLLLDPLRDRLAAGASHDLLALALAAWICRARGHDDAGAPIELVHPLAGELAARARAGGSDPRPTLRLRALFGDLADDETLVRSLGGWMRRLNEVGALNTLKQAAQSLQF